ncbi:unnamed protein product [Calypogeia fissa]
MRRSGDRDDGEKRFIRNWERLVREALRSGELKAGSRIGGRPDELGGVVSPSLGQASNIDIILQAAEEIQLDDPQVACILCEYAYSMAHTLDPQSEGRGVLQFKTRLMSVIRQKQSKKEGERIDRTHDIQRIQEFYELYRAKHQIDELVLGLNYHWEFLLSVFHRLLLFHSSLTEVPVLSIFHQRQLLSGSPQPPIQLEFIFAPPPLPPLSSFDNCTEQERKQVRDIVCSVSKTSPHLTATRLTDLLPLLLLLPLALVDLLLAS